MEEFTKTDEAGPDVLELQLKNAGINIDEWGNGQAKTLSHLQKEIEDGESVLVNDKEGKLLRKVVVGDADVYYVSSEGKKYRLREDKQVFKDGRERSRGVSQSVSEKMKSGEDPSSTMIRGIREELGISGDVTLTETGTSEQLLTSTSYPGLQSQYTHHKFEVILNDEQFNSGGYTEEQPDKTTYFIWEEVA